MNIVGGTMMTQDQRWEWEATRDEDAHERWLNGDDEPDPDEAYDQWVEDNLLD